MEFSDLITYFSQGAIVLVTLRMARSRGQNHWLWGGASILLIMASRLLGLNEGTLPVILGMAPMAFLLFFRRAPQAPVNIPEDRVICPKCKAYHATGHNFCVNCGWQLDRPYASEGTTPEDSAKVEQPEAAATLASEVPTDAIPAVQEEVEAGASATVVASQQATTADSLEEPRVEPIPLEPIPAEPPPKPAFRFPLTAAGLTEREVEVLRVVALGLTDAQVAERLVLSARTVNSHLRSIYSKLEVSSRIAAVRYALDHDLLP